MADQERGSDLLIGRRARWRAHYVLIVLGLANVLNVADRNIMSLLLEPIKHDLHASDTAMSLLTGASFVIFYSLFGIPIARWADVGNRRNILSLGIAVWSLMTTLCGFMTSFVQMATVRAGVGIGEASGTPTSISLIADYYARESRPQMISYFNLAVPLGAIAVSPLIGFVTDSFSWRMAFIVMGILGIIVALLVLFTVPEPNRGSMDKALSEHKDVTSLGDAVQLMFQSRPFVLILVGTAITGLGGGTLGAWGPAMMMRVFHASPTQVAGVAGPLIALAGIIGTLGGGMVTTRMSRRSGSERWVILLPALASLITIPAGVAYVFAPSFTWMIVTAMIGSGTIAFRTSPYLALALNLVPANCRGLAAAATLIATSVVGQAGGPLVVGIISDSLVGTIGPADALRAGFLFAPLTLAVGVVPFFIALRDFDRNALGVLH